MNKKFDSEVKKQCIPRIEKLFEDNLGLKILSSQREVNLGVNYFPDYFLSVQIGQYKVPIVIEIKRIVDHVSQIKKVMEISKKIDGVIFFVAYLIEEEIKEKLRSMKIGFYEVDKEVFLPLDFVINGRESKLINKMVKEKGFRAESSMKMLLYFVCNPKALNFTQRDLGEKLDMSLGAVNKAIKNLEALKLVVSRSRKRYLGMFEDIVQRWRISLNDLELKDHFLGKFSTTNDDFLRSWNKSLVSFDSYWGGEAAASIRTKYLTPELFRIHTYNDKMSDLIKGLRLKRDPNGRIQILKCFWPEELNNSDGTVPDFVTYCELLNSGIDRNIETAGVLKGKILQQIKGYEL